MTAKQQRPRPRQGREEHTSKTKASDAGFVLEALKGIPPHARVAVDLGYGTSGIHRSAWFVLGTHAKPVRARHLKGVAASCLTQHVPAKRKASR